MFDPYNLRQDSVAGCSLCALWLLSVGLYSCCVLFVVLLLFLLGLVYHCEHVVVEEGLVALLFRNMPCILTHGLFALSLDMQ